MPGLLPNPGTFFSLWRAPMCQSGCSRPVGNRPDAVHCKLPLLTASLEPSGIPSSHCSAFVYRKPDTNEISLGTPGTKFPPGTKCSSFSPFLSDSQGIGAISYWSSTPALGFWGAEECEETDAPDSPMCELQQRQLSQVQT